MSQLSTESGRPLAWLRRLERWASAGLVAAILLLMTTQVVARYVFGTPIPWSEEVASFAFVWLAFVGGALVAGERNLLTVDVVSAFLGPRGRLVLNAFGGLIVTACCLMMVVGSAPFVRRLAGIGSPAAGIPRRWWYLASAVGLSLVAIHAIAEFLDAWSRGSTAGNGLGDGVDEPDRRSTAS
ncbi:MAG: TRAP transporter small permease [Patescibacteria group bacterium]|nr:TRAP transporter small permease [Patescibacteria group bacterium]